VALNKKHWRNGCLVAARHKVYSIDMLSVFCSPSRYTQGRNATASLGQEIVNLGLEGPALIVAGKSAIALLSGVWQSSLHAAGLMYSILRFGGECSPLEIERGKAAARQSDARIIIGAGGGKVLDTARAVASDLNLPVVNCPTVASSDAPCSALSVVYTDEGVFQEYRIYRRNPDLVLVDTEVIARSPARLLVAGMGDALATWFEAKVCADGNVRNMRGGASTRSALALAELCYRTLLEDGVAGLHALQTQVVTPALDRLVEANTLLSGLGFESSGLAAAHAIHNGLTAAAETHPFFHGEKVAFGVLVQLLMESKPRATVEEVLDFSTSVGLPITFADIGLVSPGDEVLKQIAHRGTAEGETIYNEPFKVSSEVVVDALRAANDAGEDWKRRHRREMSTPAAD
jgi:glycerol dehydrogenase